MLQRRHDRLAFIVVEAGASGRSRASAIRLSARSDIPLRWRVEGLHHYDAIIASGRQPVMGFWHGRILTATYYFRQRGIVVITSENFDGEWIARIIERFGYGTARGSTSRGGRKAMLQLVRDMKAGRPAGFTLDGPRGPAQVAQPGAVWLAATTAIRYCHFTSRLPRIGACGVGIEHRFPSRSKTVALVVGEPIEVTKERRRSARSVRIDLERRLASLERTRASIVARGLF